MQNEYTFQLDRRDEYMKIARREIEASGDKIRDKAVFEARDSDYSQFNNTYTTYRMPTTNPFMEKVKAFKSA